MQIVCFGGQDYVNALGVLYLFRVRARQEEIFNWCLLVRSKWIISRSLTVQGLSDLYHAGPCNFQASG